MSAVLCRVDGGVGGVPDSLLSVDALGSRVDLDEEVGDRLTLSGPVSNADGSPFVWAGSTAVAQIRVHPSDVAAVGSFTVDMSVDGQIVLTLTESVTAGLGAGKWWWALRVTTSGAPVTWLYGVLRLSWTANH